MFRLGIPGFSFADLFRPDALARLHDLWLEELRVAAPETAGRFDAYRAALGAGMTPEAISEVLVETAPHVGAFVARP